MRLVISPIIVMLLCNIQAVAADTTVHRWVDAEGVTHFSDAAPEDDSTSLSTVEFNEDFAPAKKAEDDYYSIANQWGRMRAEREAKNKLSLEKARLRAEQEANRLAAIEPAAPAQNNNRYYPVFGRQSGYGYRNPHARQRHGYRDPNTHYDDGYSYGRPGRSAKHLGRHSNVHGSRASRARAQRSQGLGGQRSRGRRGGSGASFGIQFR